jgi:F420-0:gamma-glutamyl ligase
MGNINTTSRFINKNAFSYISNPHDSNNSCLFVIRVDDINDYDTIQKLIQEQIKQQNDKSILKLKINDINQGLIYSINDLGSSIASRTTSFRFYHNNLPLFEIVNNSAKENQIKYNKENNIITTEKYTYHNICNLHKLYERPYNYIF